MADEGRVDGVNETDNTTNETADAAGAIADIANETANAASEPAQATSEAASAANVTQEQAEPRWGFLIPLLTAGFCPAKTARRTDHLGVADAIATHVVAWVVMVIILLYMFYLGTDEHYFGSFEIAEFAFVLLFLDGLYLFGSSAGLVG